MKKCKKAFYFLDTGIFPATVLFSCGFSYDEIIELLKNTHGGWAVAIQEDKEFIDKGCYFGLKRTVENLKSGEKRTYFFIIITEPFDFKDYSYCKLAHEVLHICQFFLPDILDRDREYEAEAYLHTHLMSQCLRKLRGEATQ